MIAAMNNSARYLMREVENGFVQPVILILKMEPCPLAVANNLELADIPPELSDLNILERHLIAKCITFAKIIPLPKGQQRAIRGNVVCVPSEVTETVNCLPRLRGQSQVLRVKLKRRLCYKGHQLFQTVTWSKLVQALHKLKHIHPQYEDVTIRDEAELCDPTLPDDDDDTTTIEGIYSVAPAERNSPISFFRTPKLEAMAFPVQFPTAEMRWPEVIEAIKSQQGEEVNFDELDWVTKCEILRSNPVTTMRMFDKRVEALYRDLILSPAEPLGKVVDYFYRLEFQHRGSPHIHCLLWVDGAPVFEEDGDQTICDFVSKYISAQLPDPDTQPELYKKVTEVQIHSKNHSRTCFKSASSGCRFGFPKPPCRKTMITRPMDDDDSSLSLEMAKTKLTPLNVLLNEPETASLSLDQLLARCNLTHGEYEQYLNVINQSNAVIMKRDPKDCWVNGYNPYLLEAWDANIDVQYILNYYSLIYYICTYICKSENSVSQYLKTLIKDSNRDNVNECDEMREIMQAYSKKREVSAQECVTRACGIKMKKCSRGVVFIPTDDNAVKMSRPMSYLESTTAESVNVWMASLTDKYKARPETPEFEIMCMADFAATCRIVYGQQSQGKNVLRLLNEMGFVQKRETDKPAIIRFHRTSQEKYPEQFYGMLLKLYLPYRSDLELKRQHSPTYESFYNNGVVQLPGSDHPEFVRLIVKRNQKKYEKNSEEIENALEDFEQNRGLIDEWCNLAPESELVRLECIEELEARQPDHENVQDDVPDYAKQANAVTEVRAIREVPAIDPTLLRQMYQNLNQKQACVFYAVRDWCIKRVCGQNPEQFFFYINGGAGTGKSHLIKCIYSEASKILCKLPRRAEDADISNPTVLLTAFTGTAAFNISGTTLHSLLKLPRSLKPPFQGLGNKLDEVRCELLNAEIIIIDEVSMVSKPLFAYVDARLKQIKGTQRPFGGMSVLAVGDFYQLPPVRQSKTLCVYDPCQVDLWQEHFQMITLTEIMRQKDDVAFAEMLNRIRVKEKNDELSIADRALLLQTVTEPALCPTDVLHIFATNKQEGPTHWQDDTPRKTFKGNKNDLSDTLNVAEGARVMLTRNIDISQGLVNGSFATLGRIVTSEQHGFVHVNMLGLTMDDPTAGLNYRNRAPGEPDNLVYIDRDEEKLKQKGVVRRQFPIKLAFACTIHKVQAKYMPTQKSHTALQNMRQVDLDNMMPLLHIKQTLSECDTLTIVHHNIEGLPPHVNDMKSHHELCLADVLCLTETHLQGSFVAQSLQLEGYKMYKRNRNVSYTNLTGLSTRSGGGVAVYVMNHFQVHEKQYVHNVTDLEFLALKIETPVRALIAVVYRPPDYSVTSFLSNLQSLLDSLEIMDYQPIIVCGDFNENLLAGGSKPILELFQSRGYVQLITDATTEKNTLLDPIFISQPQRSLHSGVIKTYYSYHNPVYCVMN
ncbi:ATP-dependent DNA helicase PIF1 [Collichthys lucidus]|uniref:ATP-dependent DNA helicase n=1 Tax=Collichthys lucidus TaxID=240159 RepID=A0A4U5TYE4_COLLU|nr:ATP-dependent DNA helicase PIF1 [Collichthys lucidus]